MSQADFFKRKATLIAGTPTKTVGKVFDGLRIAFEIEKNSESTANPGKIMVYNLSKQSRAEFEEKDRFVILQAGYLGRDGTSSIFDTSLPNQGGGILTSIFSGNIQRSFTDRNGPDLVTTIEVGDGEKELKETVVDKSFAPGISVGAVITSLVGDLGLAIGTVRDLATDIFRNGFSASGRVSEILDELVKKQGLEWHVQDGEVNVLKATSNTKEPTVILSPTSGLIGVPSKMTGANRDDERVEFTSLLNPKIKPGVAVILNSTLISGTLRVKKTLLSGDTRGPAWYTKVEATPNDVQF